MGTVRNGEKGSRRRFASSASCRGSRLGRYRRGAAATPPFLYKADGPKDLAAMGSPERRGAPWFGEDGRIYSVVYTRNVAGARSANCESRKEGSTASRWGMD